MQIFETLIRESSGGVARRADGEGREWGNLSAEKEQACSHSFGANKVRESRKKAEAARAGGVLTSIIMAIITMQQPQQ
jgi:hypothetical protein